MKDKYVIIIDGFFQFPRIYTVLGAKAAKKLYSEMRSIYSDNVRMAKVVLDYGEEV